MPGALSTDAARVTDALDVALRDADRLEAVRACDMLDTAPEAAFDRVVDLALAMFGVPMAAVSVIDSEREWFKARRGFDVVEVAAGSSFGARTLLAGGELVVLDATRDRRFRHHPIAGVRFCAAAVVRARNGQPIGAVSIMDQRPWAALAADRRAGLHALARLVEAELALCDVAECHDELKRRFSDLAKVSSDLVWDTDIEHRFVNFDTEMPGMAPLRPFALGKRRWDFKQSEPLVGTWADHLAVLEARREFRDFEYKLVTSLGEAREMRISGRPVYDRRGHFIGYRGASTDITQQRAHERELSASATRLRDDMMKLRSIIESSGALILLVDRSLKIALANHTFLQATGRRLDEVVGAHLDDVVGTGANRGDMQAWLEHRGPERLKPFEFDRVIDAPDGTRRVLRVTASAVQDDSGTVEYILFLGVDETERRATEVQLLDAARLATVGQMATGMAHEINQPLTVLQFAVEGLTGEIEDNVHRDDPEGFAADTYTRLKRMEDQIKRASGIIRSLQGFAHRADKPSAFDVEQAIIGAVGLVDEQIRLAGLDLHLRPTGALPKIAGHANRLQQVLINLMINARDALNEADEAQRKVRGRGRITLSARHDATHGAVVIEVADNGTGIPAEVLPRLFEPFFTTKPSGKGTGLGLSISSEIVRKMDGAIAVENQPVGGALFRLSFPVAPTA